MRYRLLVVVAMGLPLCLSAGTAAASPVCDRLLAHLSAVPEAVPASDDVRSYAGAVARQNIELRKVKSDMRRLGCSSDSVAVYGGENADQCDALVSTVERMERNLQILDKKRREYAISGGTQNVRRRLLAALDSNGCNDAGRDFMPTAATDDFGDTDPELTLSMPMDDSLPTEDMPEGAAFPGLRHFGDPSVEGGLRTVCVRTCDGGFFPISTGASPLDFRRDQRVCAMMCPETETELYYHALSSPESGDMVSTVTGKPYSTLPAAFAYRTRDLSKPGSCGCDLSAYYRKVLQQENALAGRNQDQATATGHLVEEGTGSVTTIRSKPVPKPAEAKKEIIERPYDPASRKVRTVGPTFLPENESAIDLRNPAEPGVH
ncbi:DUF2865 domain-containing protein [Sinorhizobium sp. BG8]|uniref:DUF2865 domain-containing protein n=1 Tax=Sinorhizobium sp. BG8 TaxID=2613773 RepID=UPI001FEDC720|nr:DUF2865 domain-containing protein [Sinorhizobium sp. BG8]